MILRRQLLADFGLVRGRLPIHIGNLIVRPQILLWIAVAIQTPTHGQFFGLKHERHLIDLPVAGCAANAFRHMDRMVAINIVGQRMDPIPRNRLKTTSARPASN